MMVMCCVDITLQFFRFIFSAVFKGLGFRLSLLGEIVGITDRIMLDRLSLVDQLLAVLADLVFDGASLGLGVIDDSASLFVRLILNDLCLVFQLISLSGGLFFDFISGGLCFICQIFRFLLCSILHLFGTVLGFIQVIVSLGRVITASNQQCNMEAKSTLFQIFIVCIL
ncbi:MAG: hypothetical protein G5703_00550 [Serratia symbiotica]|nr:hypothetical protein [Serratia symbiotica]